MNSGCNCCEEPPCEAPTLEFISVAAMCDAEPCGEADPGQDPPPDPMADPPVQALYCRTVTTAHGDAEGTTTKIYTLDELTGACSVACSGSWTHKIAEHKCSFSYVEVGYAASGSSGYNSGTITSTYNADCTINTTTDTTASSHLEETHIYTYQTGSYTETITCNGTDASGTRTHTQTYTGEAAGQSTSVSSSCPADYSPCDACSQCPTAAPVVPDEVTYTECTEVPPCNLVFPAYPAWPDTEAEAPPSLLPGQGNEASAFRDWSPDGTAKTGRNIKWRLTHAPTGTCYLKVWIRKTFTPEDPPVTDPPTPPTPPTITDETYVWTGSGNPCLAEPMEPVNSGANRVLGDATEVLAGDVNGETIIELLKFSCLEGYEPNIDDGENPQPNGYPDPSWSAAP